MAAFTTSQEAALTSSNSSLGFNLTNFNTLPKELVLALPRLISRAGAFAFYHVPERVDHLLGLGNVGTIVAEAAGGRAKETASAVRANASTTFNSTFGSRPEATGLPSAASRHGFWKYMTFKIQSFGGMFAYLTSKWAILCFAVALILNRTSIYASSRRRNRLPFPVRLALRITPIILFAVHATSLLQAIRCQTSPNISSTHPLQSNNKAYTGEGGFLYRMSSALLFFETEHESCLAVKMFPSAQDSDDMRGSFSLLWPLFKSLCIGHLVETLSCTVQGRTIKTETGLSVFEHSLAFAEAEAIISGQLGFTRFTLFRMTANSSSFENPTPAAEALKQSQSFAWMHTTPEVLLMALISSLNNLTSHLLAVFDKQSKFRLVNTGLWGICFMFSVAWGFVGIAHSGDDGMLTRFPTVCVVGFIPHLLLAVGIMVCGGIYLAAFTLTILSPSLDGLPRSFSERAIHAHENLQMHTQLTGVPFDMREDFYTALMKFGFAVLTGASEAVYLNEGRSVNVRPATWLEEEQMTKFEKARASIGDYFAEDIIGGVSAAPQGLRGRPWTSGYDMEMKTMASSTKYGTLDTRVNGEGVGLRQRTGRMIMTFQFFTAIFWLSWRWFTVLITRVLDAAGLEQRPELSTRNLRKKSTRKVFSSALQIVPNGKEEPMAAENIDVASEMKEHLQSKCLHWDDAEERKLDTRLYNMWLKGGWWGDRDESTTYVAPSVQEDEDTTSVISTSFTSSEISDWESFSDLDHFSDGARTPTQHRPYPPSRSPSLEPLSDNTLDASNLASLLDPKSADDRQKARILAHHLTSDRVLTRSQYRNIESLQGTALLSSAVQRPTNSEKLFPDQEVELLERFIISRRTAARAKLFSSRVDPNNASAATTSWAEGASGLGAGGPQCVVCQSAPRTILSWPCRCLSLCEECRVSLAKGNFGTCVCCRQDVVGFSRLFVP